MEENILAVEVIGSPFVYIGKGDKNDPHPYLQLKEALTIPIELIIKNMCDKKNEIKTSYYDSALSFYKKEINNNSCNLLGHKNVISP